MSFYHFRNFMTETILKLGKAKEFMKRIDVSSPVLLETLDVMDGSGSGKVWKKSMTDDLFELICLYQDCVLQDKWSLEDLMSAIHDGWAMARLVVIEDPKRAFVGANFDKIELDKVDPNELYHLSSMELGKWKKPLSLNASVLKLDLGTYGAAHLNFNKRYPQLVPFTVLKKRNRAEAAKDAAILIQLMIMMGTQIGTFTKSDFAWDLDAKALDANYSMLEKLWSKDQAKDSFIKLFTRLGWMKIVDEKVGKKTELVFCYGSNHVAKLSAITGAKDLAPIPALIHGYKREFVGYSDFWKGAVATILPSNHGVVHGVMSMLTMSQLHRLDKWEWRYWRVREQVYLPLTNEYVTCWVYVHKDPTKKDKPSKAYMDALRRMLSETRYK